MISTKADLHRGNLDLDQDAAEHGIRINGNTENHNGNCDGPEIGEAAFPNSVWGETSPGEEMQVPTVKN